MGGWPYLIRQDRSLEPGGSLLHIATGIQQLADARLIAEAPQLAEALFRLLLSPTLTVAGLDPLTAAAQAEAWAVLVRAAVHLEI